MINLTHADIQKIRAFNHPQFEVPVVIKTIKQDIKINTIKRRKLWLKKK